MQRAAEIDGLARAENRQKEWRFGAGCLLNLCGRRKDDIHGRKTVRRELFRAPQMATWIAFHWSDDQQIHVAVFPHSALGVRAEKYNTLGRKGADEPIECSPDKRRQRLHGLSGKQISLRHSSPGAQHRQ
jgi:hypothetical protein